MNSSENKKMSGKVALITGAGRGIGRAFALAAAKEGASIALVARTKSEIEQVCEEVQQLGSRAIAIPTDVCRDDQIESCVKETLEKFGKVDVLVNNAGGNDLGSIVDQDPKIWWNNILLSIRAPYLLSRAFAPQMLKNGWGRIINVSSVLGKRGAINSSAYCSGKAGLIGLTRALACEFAKSGITVNAICPGYVDTALTQRTFKERAKINGTTPDEIVKWVLGMVPVGKAMKPDDLVPAFLFLVSEEASFTTGDSINVSGGWIMH